MPECIEIYIKNIFNCKVSLMLYTTITEKSRYEGLKT
nr:MAG TPA: hypothetical protein [Caudoviricetes sp.]